MESLLTKTRDPKAFSLIEVLVAIVIFTIFATGVFTLGLSTMDRNTKTQTNNEALSYAQEGLEAVRNIRDRNFVLVSTGEFGLDFSGDTWSFITAPETIDDYYQRTITIEEVYRDSSGDIAETGTLDDSILKVTSEVTWDWKSILPKSVSLVTYLADWRGSDWVQTTCTEFAAGTLTYAETSEEPAPPEDNCLVQLELLAGLSAFYSYVDIGDDGEDVVVDGNYAYVATADSSDGLTIIDISVPESPVVVKQIDVDGRGRYVTINGDYLYMGVRDSSDGLAVVDITDPPNATLISNYDVDSYGNQPVVSENYLYMGIERNSDSFRVFDISNPGVPVEKASLNFGGETNVIAISGNYAYAGVDKSTNQLKIIDISNPLDPEVVAEVDVGDEILSLAIDGSIAYVGTEDSDDALQIVNISDPENPVWISSMETNDEMQDMAIDSGYLYMAVDLYDSGLEIASIANPVSPYIAYYAENIDEARAVDISNGKVFMALDEPDRGFVIVETVNPKYSSSGSLISDVLDTGSEDTRYNFIQWDNTDTVSGTVKFKIRTASTEAGLSSATWVGSDGTAGTWYETSGTEITLSPGASGKRYIQFKAVITSDGIETPTLEEVKINYTP